MSLTTKIGYVRVSTRDQHTDRQETIMKRLGVDKIFIDKASGKNADRPKLKKMLDYIREGDTVIVESFSRLARSTKDLLDIVDVLNQKNVALISQKEAIDTNTPVGRFFLTITAALSTLERESMLERQREGQDAARAAGRFLGRRPKEYDRIKFGKLYVEWKNGNITATSMRKRMGMSSSTFYRRVREFEKSE